jgi:hypothetical protein
MKTKKGSPMDLSTIKLDKGAHAKPEKGMCLMEAVAYVQRQPFNDHPKCVSPVLGAYGRSLNDCLPDDERQRLVPLIPGLINTAGDGKDETRAWIAVNWFVRTYTPTFMRLVPSLVEAAVALEELPQITDEATLRLCMEKLTTAREKSAAAGAAARAAAWDAAWDAAGAAAGAATWDAAGAAARAAAWDAAGAAAWDAARDAAGTAAWAAARTAAGAALAPTVKSLQSSAIELFSRLIEAAR